MKGKMNAFQKAMLRWNEFHPYNAVHVLRVLHNLDRVHLRQVITKELEELSLGGYRLARKHSTYMFCDNSDDIELRFIPSAGKDTAVVLREVEAELNRTFPENNLSPFRFFTVETSDSFYLALTYFHAIAGAESIALLLRSIVNRYMNRGSRPYIPPLDLYPQPYGIKSLFRPSLILAQTRMIIRHIGEIRRSCRPLVTESEGHRNAFTAFPIGPEQFHNIVIITKQWGITLNDFFLAVILKSLSPLSESRFKASRRRRISVASIANIRKDLKVDASRTFGLFLGSFSVSSEVPEGITLEALARDVRRQTDAIKKNKTYLLFPLLLKAAEVLVDLLAGRQKARFYARNYPLWAGLTNMNLNTTAPLEPGEDPGYYLRGVCTGPVTPCVFAITTAGEKINVGLSYRPAVYKPEDIEGIIKRFLQAIEETGV